MPAAAAAPPVSKSRHQRGLTGYPLHLSTHRLGTRASESIQVELAPRLLSRDAAWSDGTLHNGRTQIRLRHDRHVHASNYTESQSAKNPSTPTFVF